MPQNILANTLDKQVKKLAALLEAFDMPAELSVSDYQPAAAIYSKCRLKKVSALLKIKKR